MVTLLVAGHETTAIALSWTWYPLAHNPEVDAKLHRNSVTSSAAGRRP